MLLRVRFGGKTGPFCLITGLGIVAFFIIYPFVIAGRLTFVPSILLFVGLILALNGAWIMRGGTSFTIDDTAIVIHALIGPIKRTSSFGALSNLTIAGAKVFMTTGSQQTRIPVVRNQANAEDWRKFEALLAAKK